MGGPSEYTIRMREEIAAFVAKFARAPQERAESAVAARVIALWEARRARGAEPLFVPTIGAAIRAGRPMLAYHCPGCGMAGRLDLRILDRHPGASIGTLIPRISKCTRCVPLAPFAKIDGLEPDSSQSRQYG